MKPTNVRHTESGRKKLVEQNFSDREWEGFPADDDLPKGKTEEMRQFIFRAIAENDVQKQLRKLKILRITKYASAAVIVLVAGIVFYFGNAKINTVPPSSQPQLAQYHKASKSIWKKIGNAGHESISYQLPDSSVVTVYPKSSIKFEKAFNKTLRNVYLKGKATFKVAHDKTRPFSVFAGGLKTTALGTSFTINTGLLHKRVSVKLHTGRIVVANTSLKRSPTYISKAGTTLLYNPATAIVKLISRVTPTLANTTLLQRNGDIITMKNIPLAKVIGLLQETYQVHITVDQKEINKITYTGKIDVSKEKAEDVIRLICLINNMTVTKINEIEFNIEKTKQ
ncbi:FecR family protein [Pedobacter sp. BMA]|uniref:FecR family protein n=1 Tax=Pedobacter sp. BMA TaxID=1663685 RepID=UPI000649EB79|nr:FecR family protein [Pedobacter sp. BMA]KLT64372.1 hypothetical protein AB669_17610 [Pedobacter sp. BMA]